jgi:hypothetical protein
MRTLLTKFVAILLLVVQSIVAVAPSSPVCLTGECQGPAPAQADPQHACDSEPACPTNEKQDAIDPTQARHEHLALSDDAALTRDLRAAGERTLPCLFARLPNLVVVASASAPFEATQGWAHNPPPAPRWVGLNTTRLRH